MNTSRLTLPAEATIYHVVTRATRGEYLFGDLEKERMRRMLWQMAEVCGLEVLTYAVMSNHLHVVVRVPAKEEADAALGNGELLRRFGVWFGASALAEARKGLMGASEEVWAEFRGKYLPMMHDLSWFMRLLKQRFSRWYNAYHKTFGTLWAERFTSVVIEGGGEALLAVCAYVDLNPVRARIVEDPKQYRWSGYGEAVGGRSAPRMGLEKVTGAKRGDWRAVQARYRLCLYAVGTVVQVKRGRKLGAVSDAAAEKVWREQGALGWAVALQDRVGYFVRGGVLGSKDFVDRVFALKRGHFPATRKDGARRMRGGVDWGEMRSLRDLRG